MEKGKKIKNRLLIFILAVMIVVLLIYFIYNLFDYLNTIEKKEYYARVKVSNFIGVEVNGSAMVFGMVRPGSSSRKTLVISNSYDCDVKVDIYSKGDIKDFLIASENNFILKKNETKNIQFEAKTNPNTPLGIYEGDVFVVVKKI